MTDAERRIRAALNNECGFIFGTHETEISVDDIKQVLEDLAEQRMLCDLYRKEALGQAEDKAAEYMAQHDLT